MDRSRLLAPGLWMMAPAPVVVSMRALLALADAPEPAWYWVLFALGGSLSGLGIIMAAVATHRTRRFPWVVAGAVVAIVGHYVLPRFDAEAVALWGPSLVHAGTGLVLWPWRRLGLAAGLVAGLGALLRWDLPALGNGLLLAGAATLAVLLVLTGRDAHAGRAVPRDP